MAAVHADARGLLPIGIELLIEARTFAGKKVHDVATGVKSDF